MASDIVARRPILYLGEILMKRTQLILALAALFVVSAALQAQETYTIKLKERGEGETAVIKRKETTSTKVVVSVGGNQVVDTREIKSEVKEFKEQYLKLDDKKIATKLQREYAKVELTKDNKKEEGALAGKTVIIEKKGNAYDFTYKNGDKVEGQAAAELAIEFGKKKQESAVLEKLMLPPGAVKVGDTWKIDVAKIAELFGKDEAVGLDVKKSVSEGKLIKAYKKDGRQFGVMKFKLDMPLDYIGKGKEQLKFTSGAKMIVDIDFDVCIDGGSENGVMTMKMNMKGMATLAALEGATAMMDVSVDGSQVIENAPKK
jgi:hypothetical protein